MVKDTLGCKGKLMTKKLNELLEKIAKPLKGYSSCLLRIGLGISFFLHGYGKIPIQQSFIDWLASKGDRMVQPL